MEHVSQTIIRDLQRQINQLHPTDREAIPDAVDQLHAAVRNTYGEDSDLYRAMQPLYALACKELKELEEADRQPSDAEEFRAAHAATLRSEARAIRNEYRR